MAKEALYVPEDDLAVVIKVIRAGVRAVKPPADVAGPLLAWCDEEEEYLRDLEGS